MDRPRPPESIFDDPSAPVFVPAPDLIAWCMDTFIAAGAPLLDEDHRHLAWASLGALWTNVPNGRAGRRIIGQRESSLPPISKWGRARVERQTLDWFGEVPTFLLTFDAEYARDCSEAEVMALVEHELYHAGQERDQFGAPKFRKNGNSAFEAMTLRNSWASSGATVRMRPASGKWSTPQCWPRDRPGQHCAGMWHVQVARS